MKYLLTIAFLTISTIISKAQIEGFPKISAQDLSNETYTLDSNANAIVLLEKGRTSIESSESDRAYMVFCNYKIRIKILKQEGYENANFTIPLYKYGGAFEYIKSIKGSTYNLEDNGIHTINLEQRNIFLENSSEYVKLSKFTLPNVKVGSIIDVEYTIASPDIFNFRTWEFQSTIPKIKSEYNVLIPAVYKYNVTLKGFLKLKDTKTKVYKECLSIFNTRVDCSDITYSMENIPAFVEEDFMLAPKNYLSSIYFELEEAYREGGAKQIFTKQWKDVDRELLNEKSFGGQLKKEGFIREIINPEILAIANPNERAIKIFEWVQNRVKWNNYYGKYGQYGIEDAIKNKSGNIADINLTLITALNAANIEAYPILVSSRENGLPHHLHPVISDFNYLIAGVKLDEKIIQLDASDRLLPFAQLPLRAINGEGRIIYSKKSSEWISLENPILSMSQYFFNGQLELNGTIKGKMTIIHNGLDAYNKRREIIKHNSISEFTEKLDERLNSIDVTDLQVYFLEDLDKTLNIEADIVLHTGQEIKEGNFTINPIFIDRLSKNPFNLDERNYPVDLGSKKNESFEISIKMPEGVTLVNAPKNTNLILPDNSARYIYKSDFLDGKLITTQQLSLNKSIYSSDEYFGLKELFSRIIQHLKIDYTFNYQSQ